MAIQNLSNLLKKVVTDMKTQYNKIIIIKKDVAGENDIYTSE